MTATLQEMLDVALNLKADLHVTNRQQLTPLTLAAKLAKKAVRYTVRPPRPPSPRMSQ